MTEPFQAAEALRQQYGEDAGVIALLRAAEFAAGGDAEASVFWEAVATYLSEDPAGPAGAASH